MARVKTVTSVYRLIRTHTTALFTMLAIVAVINACDQPTLFQSVDGETGETLRISPDRLRIAISTEEQTKSLEFSASGGQEPYSYTTHVPEGIAGDPGTVDEASGLYVSPGMPIENAIVRVTDSFGNTSESQVSVVEQTSLTIFPETATISLGQQLALKVTGGVPPYNFPEPADLERGEVVPGTTENDRTFIAPDNWWGSVTVAVTDSAAGENGPSVSSTAISVEAPDELDFIPDSATMRPGESITITVLGGVSPFTYVLDPPIAGAGENLLPGDTEGYVSDRTTVYTAPTDLNEIKTATIKVTDSADVESGQASATVEITVGIPVTGVSIDQSDLSMSTGQSQTLTATVEPSDATNEFAATNQDLIWSSDTETVATVDENGTVTGVASGSAVITVTTVDGGFSDTINVNVQNS